MDGSPPGASVHGLLQAKVLEWVSKPSCRDLPHPGVKREPRVLAGGFFTTELPGKPKENAPWLILVRKCELPYIAIGMEKG